MRVAVVGSRSLGNRCYAVLEEHMPDGASEIISGGAAGADGLAERYAEEHGLVMTVIRPDYKTYDRQAPLIRNSQIIAESDYTLILWDGSSRGSLNVIMTCIKVNKPFKVLLVE
jgi:predicted Rossmann fold nucleotide-binding protein DprA/Smf involved in DNA uptake